MGLRLGVVALLTGLGLVACVARLYTTREPLEYVGSQACQGCHSYQFEAHARSRHQMMMRPVEAPGVVDGAFDVPSHELPFDPGSAVWAIGGKWEQQFMGHDGETETLLPGAWIVDQKRWQMTGWDGWQVPFPLKRCHGCHTVGLDVETGSFIEPNIGCESCHGPASWHWRTLGFGEIVSGADAQLCGQCHTRGTTPSGEFHFPAGYRPGADLEPFFKAAQPSPGQTSSYWWGNGRERKRHQEYAAWQQGGHADSLRSLLDGYDGRYGELAEECLSCHAGDYILAGYHKPGIDEVQHGITCSVCHNVHGDLAELRMNCSDCHRGGASYHQPEANADHVPCPAEAAVDCVSCHMPRTVQNGGGYTLHSHAPGITPPAEAAWYGMPGSCSDGSCHPAQPADVLQALFERHYGPEGHTLGNEADGLEDLP